MNIHEIKIALKVLITNRQEAQKRLDEINSFMGYGLGDHTTDQSILMAQEGRWLKKRLTLHWPDPRRNKLFRF